MILALVLVGFGVGGVNWVIRDGTPGLASRSWPPVPATVLAGTLKKSYGRNAGWTPNITFSFSINGKRYFSNRFSFPTTSYPRTRAEAILRHYPVGQTVTAYYNPKDPAQACLEPGYDWFFLFIIPFVSLILLSGGVLIGIMTMRGVRTDKRMKATACTVKQGFSGGAK